MFYLGKSVLLNLVFFYSTNKSGHEFGGINPSNSRNSSISVKLNATERIIKATIYEDHRNISNSWRRDQTAHIIVGIGFETDSNRTLLFGSSNGTKKEEAPKNYYLAYVRCKAVGYIDSLRLIWYKICSKNSSIFDETQQ